MTGVCTSRHDDLGHIFEKIQGMTGAIAPIKNPYMQKRYGASGPVNILREPTTPHNTLEEKKASRPGQVKWRDWVGEHKSGIFAICQSRTAMEMSEDKTVPDSCAAKRAFGGIFT